MWFLGETLRKCLLVLEGKTAMGCAGAASRVESHLKMRACSSPHLMDQNSSRGSQVQRPSSCKASALEGAGKSYLQSQRKVIYFLLWGVVLEELKLCQARAVPAWQSQSALTDHSSDLLFHK